MTALETGAMPETEQPKSVTEALEYARAYEQVAAFLTANPDLAERANDDGRGRFLVSVGYTRDPVAEILSAAQRGREAGVQVTEHVSEKFGGVKLHFGPVWLQVYASVDKVCQKVVVGMKPDVQYALSFDLDGTPRKQVSA